MLTSMLDRKDQRRSRRRPFRHRAKIVPVDGSETIPCLITDVSQTGARVRTDTAERLPQDFVLQLTESEGPRRFCHLVWRNDSQAGLRFDKEDDAQSRRSA